MTTQRTNGPGGNRREADVTRRQYAQRNASPPVRDANPWAKFTAGELEAKLRELRKLIDSGTLTDRSLDRQFTEVGIIENELTKRDGG